MDRTARSQADIKMNNTGLVLGLIRHQGPLSRADLARRTGLSATSMTRIVTALTRTGLVRELPDPQPKENGAGRPGTLLSFVPTRGYLFCVDAGPVTSTVALMDLDGAIIRRDEIEMPEGISFERFAELLKEALTHLAAGGPEDERDLTGCVLACGVSIAGHVLRNGYLVASRQLRWDELDAGRLLTQELGLPVYVENDCKAALQGERMLLNKNGFGAKDVSFFKFGWNGIGSAAIVDGNLLRGSRNAAGEIGVLGAQPEGRHEGSYLNYGSLENTLTTQSILDGAKSLDPAYDSLVAVDQGLRAGDEKLTAYMDGVCERIAIAVGTVLNTYNSERVILNGAVFRSCRGMFRLVVDYLERRRIRSIQPYIQIVLAKYGPDDCLFGIGSIAIEEAIARILREAAGSKRKKAG